MPRGDRQEKRRLVRPVGIYMPACGILDHSKHFKVQVHCSQLRKTLTNNQNKTDNVLEKER